MQKPDMKITRKIKQNKFIIYIHRRILQNRE